MIQETSLSKGDENNDSGRNNDKKKKLFGVRDHPLQMTGEKKCIMDMKILGYRIPNNDLAAALIQPYKTGHGVKNMGHAYDLECKKCSIKLFSIKTKVSFSPIVLKLLLPE